MAARTELPRFEGKPPEGDELKKFRERIHTLETTEAERFAGEEILRTDKKVTIENVGYFRN